jgi:undecaprenyl-diphosphatase
MFTSILAIDASLTTFLANMFPRTDVVRDIFLFLSLEGNWIFIWALALFILIIFEEKQEKQFIIYFAVSICITTLLITLVLKPLFQRERPYQAQKIEAIACPRDFSFPSTHAAGAFAGAAILAVFDKKRRWLYYGIALLVSYSRIYLFCHYFLDTFFGAFVGYLISKLVLSYKTYKK